MRRPGITPAAKSRETDVSVMTAYTTKATLGGIRTSVVAAAATSAAAKPTA